MTRWTFGAMAVAGLLAIGCQFEPGKKVTWTSTIDTQFGIAAGEDRRIGYSHFDDAFELNPGAVSLKLNHRADQAAGPLTPSTLTWRLSVYDSTLKTVKFQYDLDTAGRADFATPACAAGRTGRLGRPHASGERHRADC